MTRYFRAALTAALLAASAAPALAQTAPMGAPSDTTPPAPAQTSTAADTVPVQDPVVPKKMHVHRIHHHRIVAHKTATVSTPAPVQTGS